MTDELNPDEIRGVLRQYFADNPGLDGARNLRDVEPGADTDLARYGFEMAAWEVLAQDLGVAGMGAPEAWGGLGVNMSSLVAAVEETGVGLTPGPIRAAVQLGWALRHLDPEAVDGPIREAVEGVVAGTVIPGITPWSRAGAAKFADGKVDGTLASVSHGARADVVLAEVSTEAGPAAALILVTEAANRRDALDGIDVTAREADLTVAAAPAVLVTASGDVDALTEHRVVARILDAAVQVGGIEGCLAEMVEYSKVRSQFDQLIGGYQAIQHHCAHAAISATSVRALVQAAANAVDRGDRATANRLSWLAGAEASAAFHRAASSLIQVSGGIGFTWEHDAHLFFRRARSMAVANGTVDEFRREAVKAGCLDLLVETV